MKVFFDTEFTGLHRATTLISIGCVSEKNQRFYAELTDFGKKAVRNNPWIQENVFNNTFFVDMLGRKRDDISERGKILDGFINFSNGDEALHGNKEFVSKSLITWLEDIGGIEDGIEFVSDVCHYDMTLMIDLLAYGKGGSAFDIPGWVCPACHDINQDIAEIFNISETKAFDKSREGIVKEFMPQFGMDEKFKHNALYDALVIKEIYRHITCKLELRVNLRRT